jgi:Lon protease-like protein
MFALYPPQRAKSSHEVKMQSEGPVILKLQVPFLYRRVLCGFRFVNPNIRSPAVSLKACRTIAVWRDFVALLPLFPLEVVLLPGTPLPLHIFEPRYKEMIGECRSNNTPFGVIRILDEGIAEVGCTAEIITVTKEYSDGRLDLIAEGRSPFEVLELNEERAFLRAEVLLVPDEPGTPAPEDKARAIQFHLEILSLAGSVQDLSDVDQVALSFHLAGSLPLDLDFKQKLLATRSESERIVAVAAYLEGILPNLRRAARARAKAGGNGHAH